MRRATTNTRSRRPHSSCAVTAAMSGTWTATNSSNTAWDCAPLRWATRFRASLPPSPGSCPSAPILSGPRPIEVECAERFLELVPSAEMVKFAKDGSDALDGAIRLARAHTGRDFIAICGDHPFFSTSDWFIGTTAMPAGVPEWTRSRTVQFRYNDLDSVKSLFARVPRRRSPACCSNRRDWTSRASDSSRR